jgi:diguanylate cyclase (GGDEF)-like protein
MKQIIDGMDKLDLHDLLDFIEKMSLMHPCLQINLGEIKKIINKKNMEDSIIIPANEKVREFDFDEQNAMFFVDTLNHEVSITSNFFRLFDIEHKEYSFRGLIKAVFKNVEEGRELLNNLRKDIIINKEYMETVYLKSKKKLEIIYKIYELQGYKGILFNIKRIDNVTPLINYDSLTGTLNREIILDKLEDLTTFKSEKDIAVLLINLNEFRNINNLFGYKLGDYVIKSISERIEQTIRKNDILGRINGDEFILILTHYKQLRNVEVISKRILEIIEEPVILANRNYKITASIGISIFNDQNKNSSKLMSSANLALLKAKEKGKK